MQIKYLAEQHLCLIDQTNRLVEFRDGRIEVPPSPTESRQTIVEWLTLALRAFIVHLRGKVRFTLYSST